MTFFKDDKIFRRIRYQFPIYFRSQTTIGGTVKAAILGLPGFSLSKKPCEFSSAVLTTDRASLFGVYTFRFPTGKSASRYKAQVISRLGYAHPPFTPSAAEHSICENRGRKSKGKRGVGKEKGLNVTNNRLAVREIANNEQHN